MACPYVYVYKWRNNEVRERLWNRRCRIVASGSRNNVWVEFEDGAQVVTSRRALRKAARC